MAGALAVGLLVAYAAGFVDHWSTSVLRAVYATAGVVLLSLLSLTIAHSFLDVDDELVGRTASVPLAVLMDQRTYGLDLWLKPATPHGSKRKLSWIWLIHRKKMNTQTKIDI